MLSRFVASSLALLGTLFAFALPGTVVADNAIPIAVNDTGRWRVLFFSHESPVRAGLVEVSVMLLDRESGHPLSGWQLTGSIRADALQGGMENAWVSPCCRIGVPDHEGDSVPLNFQRSLGGNVFARETSTILPVAGRWKLDVQVTVPGHAPVAIGIIMNVAPPRAPLEIYWVWFAAIPVAIGAYAWSRKG